MGVHGAAVMTRYPMMDRDREADEAAHLESMREAQLLANRRAGIDSTPPLNLEVYGPKTMEQLREQIRRLYHGGDNIQETEAMQTEPTTAVVVHAQPAAPSLFEMAPQQMVAHATQVANVLRDIIKQQRLYSTISGKDHVLVEGWNTMGCFLGIMPKEREVRRLDDGSYEAFVDLVNVRTGQIVGGASHYCGIEEKRWGSADEYARRSMAVTRATGKAFRLGFSWVMKLAGYEPTPFEEMPENAIPFAPEKPKAAPRTAPAKAPPAATKFDQNNTEHQKIVAAKLRANNFGSELDDEICAAMHGRPFTDLKEVAEGVRAAFEASLSQ